MSCMIEIDTTQYEQFCINGLHLHFVADVLEIISYMVFLRL